MAAANRKKYRNNKKRKLVAFVSSTLGELLFTPFIAYIVHQYFDLFMNMDPGTRFRIDYNYVKAIQMLFSEFGVMLWFLILQVLYVFWIIWLWIKPNAEIAAINEIQVTDKIKIPVAIGNGQHGSARFTTEAEKKTIFEEFVFTGSEQLKTSGGLVVEMKKKGQVEHLRFVKNDVHTLIIGATGAGKTRRVLLESVWLQLMSGRSLVISDVKGEIFYFTSQYAASLGYKKVIIDLRNPKKSDHYNFLQPILDAMQAKDKAKAIDATWDLVSVIVGEQKGEPLWYNGETATIAAAILAVCLEAPATCRNLPNVYYFLAYMCQSHPETGKTPLTSYLATLDDGHPAKTVFAMAQVAADRTKSSFFTSALGTLRLFTNPNVAEMTSYSDFELEAIGKEKTIVYMIIPDEKKTLYPLASILIQQIYIAQVELANRNGLMLPVPTDYDLDEVGNFPTIPILSNLLSAGRSRGCRANLVIQDYQQLQSKYKDDYETIKTCCRVKIYLKSDNPKTLEEISKTLGKYTVEVTSASTSSNVNTKGSDGSVSTSSNMAGRELLTASEISRIDYPYGLCLVTGEFPTITELPDLSSYYLNKLWDLGNEKHNVKIMMEREQEREEREIGDLALWGIWTVYKEMLEEEAASQVSFLE